MPGAAKDPEGTQGAYLKDLSDQPHSANEGENQQVSGSDEIQDDEVSHYAIDHPGGECEAQNDHAKKTKQGEYENENRKAHGYNASFSKLTLPTEPAITLPPCTESCPELGYFAPSWAQRPRPRYLFGGRRTNRRRPRCRSLGMDYKEQDERTEPGNSEKYPQFVKGPAYSELDRSRHEAEMSGRIQKTLLFGKPPQDQLGFQFGVVSRPAQHVGGDFFEFFQYGPEVHDLVLGDVMGKGFPAALVGAALKAQFLRHSRGQRRGEEHRAEGSPAWILSRVHREVIGELLDLGYFATLCYARLDLARQRLEYVDCGHPPVLHYRASEGTVSELQEGGGDMTNLPLGMHHTGEFRNRNVSFSPGDIFLFYSDGLTGVLGDRNETLGTKRLGELLRELSQEKAQVLVDRIQDHALEPVGTTASLDDLTMIAVKIGGA